MLNSDLPVPLLVRHGFLLALLSQLSVSSMAGLTSPETAAPLPDPLTLTMVPL